MTTLLELWVHAALEVDALRAQAGYLEESWLRAEADADYWYFQANNDRNEPSTERPHPTGSRPKPEESAEATSQRPARIGEATKSDRRRPNRRSS